jgi:hypothetical protein
MHTTEVAAGEVKAAQVRARAILMIPALPCVALKHP